MVAFPRSVKMLLDAGMSEANVMYFIFYQPRMFTMNLGRFWESLDDVLKMGFDSSK